MDNVNEPNLERIIPDLQFSVLCDDVRREDNGKFFLIGLFEIIGAKSFPAQHPILYVVNRWSNGAGRFNQRIRLIDPDGNAVIESSDVEFSLTDISLSHTIVSRFNGITFSSPGRYWLEILLDNKLKQRYPIKLEQVGSVITKSRC